MQSLQNFVEVDNRDLKGTEQKRRIGNQEETRADGEVRPK